MLQWDFYFPSDTCLCITNNIKTIKHLHFQFQYINFTQPLACWFCTFCCCHATVLYTSVYCNSVHLCVYTCQTHIFIPVYIHLFTAIMYLLYIYITDLQIHSPNNFTIWQSLHVEAFLISWFKP